MIGVAEKIWFPDTVARWGIRRLCRERLRELTPGATDRLVMRMNEAPIAIATGAANDQHYEVPASFFECVLGTHLKYSCGYWTETTSGIDESEAAMLALCAERAGIRDGMRVLDLGCGWGSMSLWIAEAFPRCFVTAVSNSASQRRFIESRASRRGLENLEVLTADMNSFRPEGRFDRVVSIEMFEHMRNYGRLLKQIAGFLEPEGRLFVHVFCHREHAYFFEDDGRGDWMARNFFTGGLMPSVDLLSRFDRDLEVEEQWRVPGSHYQKTSNAWLERLDQRRETVRAILADGYGEDSADRWMQRWRLFFMACAESFGFDNGNEWHVAHYSMRPRRP